MKPKEMQPLQEGRIQEAVDGIAKLYEPKPLTSDLTLQRYGYTPLGTFGVMTMPTGVNLYTVERPWLGNQPSVSCIPPAFYECVPRRFFRGGYEAVEITGVPRRSHVLFHVANFPSELEGCVAVCSRLGVLSGQWAGLASRPAFDLFMTFYGGRKFSLEITEFSARGAVV